MRDPVRAGVLSFLIPGVGQLYNGRILAGILWLIFTPGFWIGIGGTLGWICHLVAAYCAYSYATEHPIREQRNTNRKQNAESTRRKAAIAIAAFLFPLAAYRRS